MRRCSENRIDVDVRVAAVPCSCEVVRPSALLVRFVLVLQMQHLQGIHTYREEASRLRTARSARSNGRKRGGAAAAAKRRGIIQPRRPPLAYIGVLMSSRVGGPLETLSFV